MFTQDGKRFLVLDMGNLTVQELDQYNSYVDIAVVSADVVADWVVENHGVTNATFPPEVVALLNGDPIPPMEEVADTPEDTTDTQEAPDEDAVDLNGADC